MYIIKWGSSLIRLVRFVRFVLVGTCVMPTRTGVKNTWTGNPAGHSLCGAGNHPVQLPRPRADRAGRPGGGIGTSDVRRGPPFFLFRRKNKIVGSCRLYSSTYPLFVVIRTR